MVTLALVTSCTTVRLVSNYDEVTDKALTALQSKVDDFIDNLIQKHGQPEVSYVSSAGFYSELDRDLRKLEFRVSSAPGNAKTVTLVANIREVLLRNPAMPSKASLEEIHALPQNAEQGVSEKALELARRSVNQAISAALTLEIQKKRGEEK